MRGRITGEPAHLKWPSAMGRPTSREGLGTLNGSLRVKLGFPVIYVSILVALGVLPQLGIGRDITEYAWNLLKGYSNESLTITEFLYAYALLAFPLLITLSFYEDEKQSKNEAMLIRAGSWRAWRRMSDKICRRFIFGYWACYAFISLVALLALYLIVGYSAENAMELGSYFDMGGTAFMGVCFVMIPLRLVELLLMYELALAVFGLTRNTIAAFLVTLILPVICAYVLPDLSPFGFSSAYNILNAFAGGGSRMAAITISPVILFGALIIFNNIRRKYK